MLYLVCCTSGIFLSTPSARRATVTASNASPCCIISIHALREEGDPAVFAAPSTCATFLSTPSARRATVSVFNDIL